MDADLVLEGGGVKGIALAGAVQPFVDAGYRFQRIAGTSSGAVVGAVLAALQHSGDPADRLVDIARSLDYPALRDRGPVAGLLGPLGYLADAVSLLRESGVYEGKYLRDWLAGVLGDLGVRTFGDLRRDDGHADGSVQQRYGLVVIASDISRRRLVQLPWDYGEYGLDPDEQPVADAVRASSSIPYVFEPVTLRGARGAATLVDGGLLSNFPIGVFDRRDERVPRWPTFGVRLDGPRAGSGPPPEPVQGPVHTGIALVETAIGANQAEHVLDPCNIARSVHVDTSEVGSLDFDVTDEQKQMLLTMGRRRAEAFLESWDYQAWLARCRGVDAPRADAP